jgi:hypothetical protein
VPGDAIRPDVLDHVLREYAELATRMQDDVIRLLDDFELTTAERVRVAIELADVSVDELKDVGTLKDAPTILDKTNRELRAVAAVWGLLSRWDSSVAPDRRLGDQLKVLPEEDARLIVEFLRWGGLVDG